MMKWITFVLMAIPTYAGAENQISFSGDMWGVPAFTWPKSSDSNFETGPGFGPSVNYDYLFENGLLAGLSYRRVGFSYTQVGNYLNRFSGGDVYTSGRIGLWRIVRSGSRAQQKPSEKKVTNSNVQLEASVEWGNGTMQVTGPGQPEQDPKVQFLGLNLIMTNPILNFGDDCRLFWLFGGGFFRRYYNFSYGGENVSGATTAGPGNYTHFNIGLGLAL